MTLIDIIKDGLKTHGYDGLYHISGRCMCVIENLLEYERCIDKFDCECCQPGYLWSDGFMYDHPEDTGKG